MAEPVRRRRRPAVSCTLCRQRKIRCNREIPCSNCVRSKNEACVYENVAIPHSQQYRVGVEQDGASSTSTVSTTPASDIESMKSHIKRLEQQLQNAIKQSTPTPPSAITPSFIRQSASSQLGGTFYLHRGDPALGQLPYVNRSITHKKRMFGQSHWINYGILMIWDMAEMIEHVREMADEHGQDKRAKLFTKMQRCKQLARVVKAHRTPSWPCSPTPDLPPKNVADELVDCYLRTTECVYRVLHIPSFKRDYESLWVTDSEIDKTFLIQLKLILAIGAGTYDHHFTLRPSAIRWVYEAETWLANPRLKHRLGFQYLQIHVLLLMAREVTAVGEDAVWVSAGALLRAAISLGLHRDPASLPPRSTFVNEMHRRLWSTILELCLNSSLNSGGPPLISLEDFDTQPAHNFDDEQLTSVDAVPKPDSSFTQVSVAIALRKTVPVRLQVAKFLNQFSSCGTYEETLRIDRELRASYKTLRAHFQKFRSGNGPSPSEFELGMVDIIMHHYMSVLHMPFFASAMHETAYAYSRKVALDSSLKTWYAANMPSDTMSGLHSDLIAVSGRERLRRLMYCGSGFLRTTSLQSVLVIGVELRTQVQEDDGLGPMPLRLDLLRIVEDAKTWSWWSIEAGETNIKGYLFMCLLWAHIDALRNKLESSEIPALLVKVAGEAEMKCLEFLEKAANQDLHAQAAKELDQISIDGTPDVFEGWDSMTADLPFDSVSVDPMSWMFDDENLQESLLW